MEMLNIEEENTDEVERLTNKVNLYHNYKENMCKLKTELN